VVVSAAAVRGQHVTALSIALVFAASGLISGGAFVVICHQRAREVELRHAAMMEERTRLAREIHDTLLQGFSGVTLMVAAAANDTRDPAQAEVLHHVADVAEKRLQEARRAVWDLRDSSTDGDFMTAIRAEADDAVKGAGLGLEFITDGRPRPIDAQESKVMLRVTREAITNAVRHANATRLRVRVWFRSHTVQLSVRDDGIGLGGDRDVRANGHHWGLRGMRERAAQIGAGLRVRSEPGAGTEVVLAVGPRSRNIRNTA
jgi:signal transduction histidine kinase